MTAPEGYIEFLIKEYHDQLYRQCRSLVKYNPVYMDRIDDCLQVVFAKAYLQYDKISTCGSTYGWLYKCCQNYFKDLYSKSIRRTQIVGKRVSSDDIEIADPTDDIIRWLEREAAKDVLSELKETLTPLELAVYQYYYEQDLTIKETADQNEMTLISVRAAVARIRAKLKGMTFFIFIFLLWCISVSSRTI